MIDYNLTGIDFKELTPMELAGHLVEVYSVLDEKSREIFNEGLEAALDRFGIEKDSHAAEFLRKATVGREYTFI
tara:strand:- start:202 stop:423 length:222 start_codon:yes stop_codon:yes gene_type:complete